MSDFSVYGRYALGLGHCLFTPGEEYGNDTIPARQWGQALGDFGDGAIVLIGSRAEILAVLAAATDDVLASFRAEHDNALHLRHPVPECPECRPGTMACPACGETDDDGNGWTSHDEDLRPLPEDQDWVRCGSCRHVWDPWAPAIAAGVTS